MGYYSARIEPMLQPPEYSGGFQNTRGSLTNMDWI